MPSQPRTPEPDDQRAAWRTAYLAAGAGLVVLAATVLLWALGGPESSEPPGDARAALEAAGCTLTEVAAPGNAPDHSDVDSPDAVSPAWNTDPPTGGPHYDETLVYGAYDEPVQQARLVHNLEHGAVFLQYGPELADEDVARLRAIYESDPNGVVLAPYPGLGGRVALGAWNDDGGEHGTGRLAICPGVEEDAVTAFVAAYRFRGPERFDPDAMTPGSS
ncbi:MAG: DUF3105 domain-containing protein [Gaiella sp.]